MKNLTSLAAIALVAAAFAGSALADVVVTAQAEPTDTATAPAEKPKVRELDVLIVTGATQDGDRWAKDADNAVPEIADSDWVPAAPAN
jgi:hypothetical protein